MIKNFYINHAMMKDINSMSTDEILYSIELITPCIDSNLFPKYKNSFITRLNLLKSIYKWRSQK